MKMFVDVPTVYLCADVVAAAMNLLTLLAVSTF
jgi:hypothetical protein